MSPSLKTCFKCGQEKPRTEFYRHPTMADGLLGKCKECTKNDVALRAASADGRKKIAAYERERFQDPARKAKVIIYQRTRRAKNPLKDFARTAVGNAVRDGRLTRLPCEVCANPKSEAHHDDYTKPLDVRWLCFKHHRELAHNQTVNLTA